MVQSKPMTYHYDHALGAKLLFCLEYRLNVSCKMGCLQNASHWQSLKSECQCKRKTPNSNVWWKFVKVWDFHGNLWILEKFWIWKIAWKNFVKDSVNFLRTCWFIKFLNQNVLAIFFWTWKLLKTLLGFLRKIFLFFLDIWKLCRVFLWRSWLIF